MSQEAKAVPPVDTPTPEPQLAPEPAAQSDAGANFFKLDDVSRKQAFDEFVGHMQRPREKMEESPFNFSPEPEPEEESITDDDEENIELFNYDQDHETTALFLIGLLDSGVGFVGTMATGMDPDRYQRFANRTPPDFYVQATAAMVKKYQAKLSLEWMFFSAIAMVYGPAVGQIRKDRKMMATARRKADEQEEMERIAEILKQRQHASTESKK